jgi:ribokinase
VLTGKNVVVLQQEIPAAANEKLIRRAREKGARISLNAAPARAITVELLRSVDVLIVNEEEAAPVAATFGWSAAPSALADAASREGTPIVDRNPWRERGSLPTR